MLPAEGFGGGLRRLRGVWHAPQPMGSVFPASPDARGGPSGGYGEGMIDVRRGADRHRGGDPAAGIDTRHAFSFAGYYDPDDVGFGLLMACNEERLAPGAGFAEHPHRDVEIVTWVIEGELEHVGPDGSPVRLGAGAAQALSAGGGVRHVERNGGAAPLRFLQMWLHPAVYGAAPSYAATPPLPPAPGLTPLASGVLPEAPLRLRQPAATLFLGRGPASLPPAPFGYLHALRGTLHLAGGAALAEGDAARLTSEPVALRAAPEAEYLFWSMQSEPSYG